MRLYLLVAVLCCSCSAGPARLYQITGDTFGLRAANGDDGFRYGPFDDRRSPQERFDKLIAGFRRRLAAEHTPGGAVAVVLDGQPTFAAGVGVLRAGGTEPVTATTRFRTASISKMVIAATIMSLVERDGMDLSRPLVSYVPYFSRAQGHDPSRVTLAMLLSHTAGIPDAMSCEHEPYGLRPGIEAHAHDPYWSPPGRLFNYSNADYALLAAVIGEHTGKPFQEVVAERVFRPAGMRGATYEPAADANDVAAGHVRGKVIWTAPTPADCEASRAAGGVIASVQDYASLAATFLRGGGEMLKPASVQAMMTGQAVIENRPRSLYAYGLIEFHQEGLRIVEHEGSAYGFSTVVRMVPDRGFAVIAFVNGTTPPRDVADAALSAFLGIPESRRQRVVTGAEQWREYAGRYSDPTGSLGRFELIATSKELTMNLRGGQTRPIPNVLRGTFVRDAEGRVEYFVTRMGVAVREQDAR